MFSPEETPIIILAQDHLGTLPGKTTDGVIRYGKWPVSAVMDSCHHGKTVGDVLPLESAVPVVSTLEEALVQNPKAKALLLGIATIGGVLPEGHRRVVEQAIAAGLHIISGLHLMLNDDPALAALAAKHQVVLWDVRQPSKDYGVASFEHLRKGTRVIATVGSDCAVGKMFTSLELNKALCEAGERSEFAATGQVGILIAGRGVPFDRVIADFMAGAVESLINDMIDAKAPQWVIVEGQGSLIHPAYSGVTLALLHGAQPDGLILCHSASRKALHHHTFEHVKTPTLPELVTLYETAAAWTKPAPVVGISINTSELSEDEAKVVIEQAQQETGLPVTDPVRFGMAPLVEALTQTAKAT